MQGRFELALDRRAKLIYIQEEQERRRQGGDQGKKDADNDQESTQSGPPTQW